MEARLNKLFEAAANAGKVPGVAAIALDASGKVLFKGAFGSTNLSDPNAPKMTTSTRAMLWSCTKLVTCVAALQLIEQGKLALDDPVHKYVPEIKELQVLEGFDEAGNPKLRAPKTTTTILMLMTHTSGLSYDIFNTKTLQWRTFSKVDPGAYLISPGRQYYATPLVHDPGTRFEYGTNIDFLGWVIEAITGITLEAYVDSQILQPLGLKNSTPAFSDGDEILYVHHRGEDGSLTANTTLVPPQTLSPRGGGHYLVSTVDDFSTFLLALLNGGEHPTSEVRILNQETVTKYLFTDFIPQLCSADGIGDIAVGIPVLTNEAKFLPDVKKGWSCGMLLNLDARAKGRGEASGAWAGLGNIFFWVDPVKGKLGLIMSEIFPFMDKEICHLFDALEREVYGHDAAKVMGEHGSNFSLKE